MARSSKTYFDEVFSELEIRTLREILSIIRPIFKDEVKTETKLFLIGMKALYYYFGMEPFSPAPVSLDIDINFDILLEWANYRKLIPQKIKDSLQKLGYNVEVELGLITIQKEDLLIHLTTVIEYSEEFISDYIPELDLDVANKYFVIYTKLSRFNQYKDIDRLRNLFKNRKIDFERILEFAPDLEKEVITNRKIFLLK